jgi:hypothetical protein
MAQKVTVQLLDDFDGSEAVGTFEFTHKGVEYAVDLNQDRMNKYTEMFEYLTGVARVIKGKKRTAYGSKKGTSVVGKTQEMREWLRANGHDVKDRGRVPGHLVDLWETRSRMPQAEVKAAPVEETPEKAPEKPVEAPKTAAKPKTPRAPRKKAEPTGKEQLATLLKFEEPTTADKPKRTRRTTANKV